jgi:hypothetical protein
MIYFFRRGPDALSCETRLRPDGPGYELVVTTVGDQQVEAFENVPALQAREHQLLQAWRAIGWRDVGLPAPRAQAR